jgi:hypothetical protein
MDEGWPKIKARNTKRVSPWMAIIEREVEFAQGDLGALQKGPNRETNPIISVDPQ